jgi:hypothetical protein
MTCPVRDKISVEKNDKIKLPSPVRDEISVGTFDGKPMTCPVRDKISVEKMIRLNYPVPSGTKYR